MAQTSIITGQYVCIRQTAATVVQRFFAWVVDLILLGICSFLGALFIGIAMQVDNEGVQVMSEVGVILALLLYPLLMEIYNDGQTIGKAFLSIKVTALDGSRPTKTALATRWLLYLVDFFCMGVGLAFVIFSKNSQRIGDLAAGTVVVKTEHSKKPFILHSYNFMAHDYRPSYPEATALSMRQVEVIERLLLSESRQREGLIAQLATKVEQQLGIRAKESSQEQFLSTIYNDFQYYATKVI